MHTKSLKLTFLLSLTVVFLFGGSSFVFGGDFEDARDAYNRKDYKEAVRLYRLSTEQGDIGAQNNLGLMYSKGQGVLQDYKEAVRLYRLSAEQGVVGAQVNLGVMYDQGLGVPQDYKEAFKWYRLAVKQGDSIAQLSLGNMYSKGQGVVQDYKEAVKWYRLSAEQGYTRAQSNLGTMYGQGQGVLKNYASAHMWWNICGSNGDKGCVKKRNIIEKIMSPSQIDKAQEMARNWLSKAQKGEVSPVIMSKEKVINNNRYLIGCDNNAEYYDKQSKKKTLEAEVSASITIDVDQQKASLSVASTNDDLIGVRSNNDLSLTVEFDSDEYVYSGVENTGDPKSESSSPIMPSRKYCWLPMLMW